MVHATIIDNGLLAPHAAIVLGNDNVELVLEPEQYTKYKEEDHMTDEELFTFLLYGEVTQHGA